MTVSIVAAGDVDATNDSATFGVRIGFKTHGVDLAVAAPDVYNYDQLEGTVPVANPITPGKTGKLTVWVTNLNDTAVERFGLQIKLPENATFARSNDDFFGCVYSVGRQYATCGFSPVSGPIQPPSRPPMRNTTSQDFEITVSADVTGPVKLDGGIVEISSIRPGAIDLKPADNSATFSVIAGAAVSPTPGPSDSTEPTTDPSAGPSVSPSVSASATGPTSASPSASGGTGGQAGSDGDDDGGGLPTTGPAAFAMVGTGLAVIVVGVCLVVLTRRRRAGIEH
ncbi:hypothetical protein [Paractinoplanes durhamensis]|uniref:hypothetical protein n=1 Tax=Paractinoplanes durhamensis TaxID=113563 RepID=UPI003632751D